MSRPRKHIGSAASEEGASAVDALRQELNQLTRQIGDEKAARDQAEHGLAKAHQLLHTSEESLRATLDSIRDGVIATNSEGRVTYLNRAAREMTGFSQAEAEGQSLGKVFRFTKTAESPTMTRSTLPEKPRTTSTPAASGIFMSQPREGYLTLRSGPDRRVVTHVEPISDRFGAALGELTFIEDVTETRALQEQLHHAQKLGSIGHLASGIAHDFNNILGGILGAAELLGVRLEDDQHLRHVNLIIDAAERAGELNSRLLNFSRRASLNERPVDVHRVVLESIGLLGSSLSKGVSVEQRLDAKETIVLGDFSLLQNALINLAVNGAHAMPEGGTLTVSTKNLELDATHCEKSPFSIEPGRYVQLSVRDTGMGMTEEVQRRAFEPFFTTKPTGKGTGLGLAAVFGTVVAHHGATLVDSEPGLGSVFHLLLPLLSSAHLDDVDDPPQIATGTGRVLLIEDEKLMRGVTEQALQELGYSVITSGNAEQALQLYVDEAPEIDLVLLDLTMPGSDGEDCFDELRRLNPNVKVILSSGFASAANVSRLQERGLAGFIKKPYRLHELSRLVQAVLLRD